jgi:hypothetical protein
VGDLPAALPAVSPLKYHFFGICTGATELREKYFQKKEFRRVISLKLENKFYRIFFKKTVLCPLAISSNIDKVFLFEVLLSNNFEC